MSTISIDRKNWKNTGKGFEHLVEFSHTLYENRGVARLRKVDPPVHLVGGGAKRRVIFQKNPFLDYVGVWKMRGGRGLFVEAKSMDSNRLPVNRDGGVTREQVNALADWSIAGAAVCVLWHRPALDEVRLVTLQVIARASTEGEASIEWEKQIRVPALPNLPVPYLAVLDAIYYPTAVPPML